MPGKFSVACTVYSLGLSGDHSLTGPNPVRLSLAVADPRRSGLHRDDLRRELGLPVEQLDQQGAGGVVGGGRVHGALDVHPGLRGEHVARLGPQVGQEHLREHPQPDIAVDAAGLVEVDALRAAPHADRRHRQAARVHHDREQVVAVGDLPGEFGREGQVAALVGGDHLVVDRHRGVHHDPVEVDQDPVARAVRIEQVPAGEVPPVDPHLLPGGVVPVLPGQPGDRVRQRDRREVAVVVEAALRARRVLPAEQPVEGLDQTTRSRCRATAVNSVACNSQRCGLADMIGHQQAGHAHDAADAERDGQRLVANLRWCASAGRQRSIRETIAKNATTVSRPTASSQAARIGTHGRQGADDR